MNFLSRIITLTVLISSVINAVGSASPCFDCSSCGVVVSLDDCTLTDCTTFRDGIAAGFGTTTSNFPGDTGSASGSDGNDGGNDAAATTQYVRQADLKPEYTICCPGTYVLAQPLELISPKPHTSLIYISSSDVTLDLNGYALLYNGSTSVPGLSGIRICPGVHNVKILNGSIRKFTAEGIIAQAQTNDPNCKSCTKHRSGSSISNITLENLDISNNQTGTTFQGSPDNILQQVYGINISCQSFSGNTQTGLCLENVSCSSITNSSFIKNKGTGVIAGLKLVDSKDITIRGNKADCNESTNDKAYGIYVKGTAQEKSCAHVIFGNETNMNKGVSESAGIKIEETNCSQIIKNRSAYNKATTNAAAYGFFIDNPSATPGSIFGQNEVTCNEATKNQVGFQDIHSNSLYRKNIATLNIPLNGTFTNNGGADANNYGDFNNFNVTFTNNVTFADFDPLQKKVRINGFAEIVNVVQNTWLNISVVS